MPCTISIAFPNHCNKIITFVFLLSVDLSLKLCVKEQIREKCFLEVHDSVEQFVLQLCIV